LRALFDALTPREHEVLAHVLIGQLNKQIAKDLATSERTIKAHRANLLAKLKVQSVAELAHLAYEAGIGGEWQVPNFHYRAEEAQRLPARPH
jgi:FixJ family two-component response regulator